MNAQTAAMAPLPAHRVAKLLLGRSPAWFRRHKAELERAGFPKPLPVTGLYDPAHILAWRAEQYRGAMRSQGAADLAGLHSDGGDDGHSADQAA